MPDSSSDRRTNRIALSPRRQKQSGIAVMVTAIMLVLALPMMGLMMDSTLLFIIKSRLQGAVDGAALAGARGLARGADGTAQVASAQAAATTYVHLNYADNSFFGGAVAIPAPSVDLSVAFQRTVTVTASVVFPGLLLKYMTGPTTVRASAAVTRKDVNVVMVLDRSGSLQTSGSCGAVKTAAANFVDQFAAGRDNVGLVTFAFSTYVNFPIANTFQSANPNVKTLVGNITCAGSTSSAAGLWKGYDQLVALNQPGALNVLLFFTDGQPTASVFNMPIANASPCSAYTPGSPSGPGGYGIPAIAKGFIPGLLNTYTNSSAFWGLNDYDGKTVSGQQQVATNDLLLAPNSTNCTYASGFVADGQLHNITNTSDWVAVPTKDIYGNSANSGYQAVTMSAAAPGFIDKGNANNMPAIALNTADDAATRIRNGVVDPVYGRGLANVLILSIGLGTAPVPASGPFLQRISNDPLSNIYDSTKPTGHYYDAPTTADLAPAFQEVASEILRLAR